MQDKIKKQEVLNCVIAGVEAVKVYLTAVLFFVVVIMLDLYEVIIGSGGAVVEKRLFGMFSIWTCVIFTLIDLFEAVKHGGAARKFLVKLVVYVLCSLAMGYYGIISPSPFSSLRFTPMVVILITLNFIRHELKKKVVEVTSGESEVEPERETEKE